MPLYGLQKLVTDLPPKPSYSLFDIDNLQQPGSVNQPNYMIVLEWDSASSLTTWAYFSPSYNTSAGQTEWMHAINATILGLTYAAAF